MSQRLNVHKNEAGVIKIRCNIMARVFPGNAYKTLTFYLSLFASPAIYSEELVLFHIGNNMYFVYVCVNKYTRFTRARLNL